MPVYQFIDLKTDEEVELDLEFSYVMENQRPDGSLIHNGRLLKRNVRKELAENPVSFGERGIRLEKTGPLRRVSMSAGFHPSQVSEARENWKEHKGVEILDNGDVKYSSHEAERKFLRAAGMYNKDEYYN